MPVSLRRGRVPAVVEPPPGLVRLEVDGIPCVAYPELTGPVEVGDEVLVNVQARELGLGSGGFDVLHANLTRGLDLPVTEGAHVMKLPYTPLQFAARHEEEGGRRRRRVRGGRVGPRLVGRRRVPGGRLLDRPGDRRHRLAARPRGPGGC